MNKRSTLPEIETIKKNQTEILKLRNSINDIRNSLESIGNGAVQMEERISELRNLEMTYEKN